MPVEARLRMNKRKVAAHRKLSNFRQKVLRKYKLLKGCYTCGYRKHFSALDFDHIDRTTKVDSISKMIRDTMSFKRIKDEVRKCTVLCSNCHRIKTYENKDWENAFNTRPIQ